MAKNNTFKQTKGFTIIEVALVLAIAGLIFLIVFIALPALQRSQRDNARRQFLARATAAWDTCRANSGTGRCPGMCDWISALENSPCTGTAMPEVYVYTYTGQTYDYIGGGGIYNDLATANPDTIYFDGGGYCNANGVPVDDGPGSDTDNFVAFMKLESGKIVCFSNSTKNGT